MREHFNCIALTPSLIISFYNRDATSKMSEIIDRMGNLSAVAQKLNTPVTTAQRLRMSDNQVIYLMADTSVGHK